MKTNIVSLFIYLGEGLIKQYPMHTLRRIMLHFGEIFRYGYRYEFFFLILNGISKINEYN
uniref:Uncharacterized protein n=1 Tax=Rhizophagus irregularis (strain DAOM 181602 / DAOM 197198 / MUCL 43194) TaxID=747089 RepID=U9UMA2_RHIID